MRRPPHSALAWALYDTANSAFPTTVIAGFFPLMFKDYWGTGLSETTSTFWLGTGASASALIAAFSAPLLGQRIDRHGSARNILVVFALLGILATAALALVAKAAWQPAILFYCLANLGFLLANVAYDSLLPQVCPPSQVHFVSSLGYSLGYLGGGLLFSLNLLMATKPAMFGLPDAPTGIRFSFLLVGLWWAVWSLPLLRTKLMTPAADPVPAPSSSILKLLKQHPSLAMFLLAYWFYIDGVDTVITMAVAYGRSIGLPAEALIGALLLVQFAGFPCALLFGFLARRFDAKRLILGALLVYAAVVIGASRLDAGNISIFGFTLAKFQVLALAIALVQGGVQSLSRSLAFSLAPSGHTGSVFGLMNAVGRYAAVLGPFLVGSITAATGSHRAGMLSLLLLFALGALFLLPVHTQKPTAG